MTPTDRILALLRQLYPTEQVNDVYARVMTLLEAAKIPAQPHAERFSERDITLITYGDTLRREGEAPLETLRRFLTSHLRDVLSTVHILPFYPYSSDDGFSVIDYYAVNPDLGTWDDIRRLGDDFRLMFDAVINHMSAQSDWFRRFLAAEPGYEAMFMTASPDDDLSTVTRPRTLPLLTAFQKRGGETVHVWTTFSADQVDLDFRSPETLLQILRVLLFYAEQGAQVIRLDAIAYLWKQVGTTSIHLPQTHAVVKLIRAALDVAAPHVILITETNVPHAENISYFGDGHDEAQMVYNFTLPPLLLHTLLSGNATKLAEWARTLVTPSEETTFFNFTASHDGIGVRPVEGILTSDELNAIIAHVERRGGRVSYRANPDGSRSPYELNITYVDAMGFGDEPTQQHVARFIVSQAIMLALAGVPAVYIHSLLGSQNNIEGMLQTGQNRTINRAKLDADTIEQELRNRDTLRAQVFDAYTRLLAIRRLHPAFHPLASQQVITYNEGAVFALERTARDGSERILALFNVTHEPQHVASGIEGDDLLSGEHLSDTIPLAPYQVRWIQVSE